jgi:hypothetical protein
MKRKCENLSYEELLNIAESFFLEELKRREQTGKIYSQSYEALLKKRQEELVEGHNDALLVQSKFEVDAITNILKEAQNLPRFGYDDTFPIASYRLNELYVGERDEWILHAIFCTKQILALKLPFRGRKTTYLPRFVYVVSYF